VYAEANNETRGAQRHPRTKNETSVFAKKDDAFVETWQWPWWMQFRKSWWIMAHQDVPKLCFARAFLDELVQM
jgi:hypothetical protein